jgi:two-component system phosphate regulon sensor histidine kinase PhoR
LGGLEGYMKRPFVIFYALITYALMELVWWGYMLISLQPLRTGMILGEGFMFIAIILGGALLFHKSLNKERKLAEQKKNFLLSVTHELKSPLASIKLYLETIQKRSLSKEQVTDFVGKCLLDVDRLNDMVENMLLAAKIENQSYTFPKQQFDLSMLVDSIINRLQINKCDLTSQLINAEIESKIEVTGDKFALTAVVTNLLENAIKYSGPCETVDVKLYTKNGKVHLEVADQGIGIADEEKSRIFDRFYRVGSEETRNTKGTGLGLYIVKQVLDKHQAIINVRDNRPAGSVFEVILG